MTQGAAPVPLISSATVRLKAEQLEYLLHGDFRTQPVEVDAGHDGLSFGALRDLRGKQKKDRSVPTIYIGNAERSFSHSANTLPASG